jgi:hypothetical protein
VLVERLLSLHLLRFSPILTYHGKGAAKGGLQYAGHSVIYTGDKPPEELPGESLHLLPPIQVIPKTVRDKLVRESRINYAKIYTIEHNVKVVFIGQISIDSARQFIMDFDSVWEMKDKITYS